MLLQVVQFLLTLLHRPVYAALPLDPLMKGAPMANLQPLTIYVPAGVVRWLESEASIATADLRVLGSAGDISAADVARTFLELGIAIAHAPIQQEAQLNERALGE
jgi:hypothetical protein